VASTSLEIAVRGFHGAKVDAIETNAAAGAACSIVRAEFFVGPTTIADTGSQKVAP
jgi:hypothetical protein